MSANKSQSSKPKNGSDRPQRFTSSERRDSILEAARLVFVRKGYAGARTKRIAKEAGINEALIYRHFQSKEELFDAAVMEPLESWAAEHHGTGPLVVTATDATEQLNLLRIGAQQYMDQVDRILPLLGIALFASEDHGTDFYTKRLAPLIDRMAARTSIAIKNGSGDQKLDSRFLAAAGIGIAVILSADARFRDVPFDSDRYADQLARLMLPVFQKS